jgi:hypothetical protein
MRLFFNPLINGGKMRKYLFGGLVFALLLALVGVASGKSTFTGGSPPHDQGIDFAMAKGGKQLTARSGPLARKGDDYLNPKHQPEKAGRVRLLFDEGVKINSGKFPSCTAAQVAAMEGTSSEDAIAKCPKAKVSLDNRPGEPPRSEATAAIAFGSTIAVVHPRVTAFNGPKIGGNPSIILHAFLSSPVANTTVLKGQLIKQGNGRILLDVNKIPPLAGGLGALTDFFATLNKKTKDKKAIKKAKKALKKAKKSGNKKAIKKAKKALKKAKKKRIHFIKAKCTGGSYQTTGTWNLGEYTDPGDLNSFVTKFTITGTDSVPCKANGDTVQPWNPGPGR